MAPTCKTGGQPTDSGTLSIDLASTGFVNLDGTFDSGGVSFPADKQLQAFRLAQDIASKGLLKDDVVIFLESGDEYIALKQGDTAYDDSAILAQLQALTTGDSQSQKYITLSNGGVQAAEFATFLEAIPATPTKDTVVYVSGVVSIPSDTAGNYDFAAKRVKFVGVTDDAKLNVNGSVQFLSWYTAENLTLDFSSRFAGPIADLATTSFNLGDNVELIYNNGTNPLFTNSGTAAVAVISAGHNFELGDRTNGNSFWRMFDTMTAGQVLTINVGNSAYVDVRTWGASTILADLGSVTVNSNTGLELYRPGGSTAVIEQVVSDSQLGEELVVNPTLEVGELIKLSDALSLLYLTSTSTSTEYLIDFSGAPLEGSYTTYLEAFTAAAAANEAAGTDDSFLANPVFRIRSAFDPSKVLLDSDTRTVVGITNFESVTFTVDTSLAANDMWVNSLDVLRGTLIKFVNIEVHAVDPTAVGEPGAVFDGVANIELQNSILEAFNAGNIFFNAEFGNGVNIHAKSGACSIRGNNTSSAINIVSFASDVIFTVDEGAQLSVFTDSIVGGNVSYPVVFKYTSVNSNSQPAVSGVSTTQPRAVAPLVFEATNAYYVRHVSTATLTIDALDAAVVGSYAVIAGAGSNITFEQTPFGVDGEFTFIDRDDDFATNNLTLTAGAGVTISGGGTSQVFSTNGAVVKVYKVNNTLHIREL